MLNFNNIDTIIFDLDGTLINIEDINYKSFAYALKSVFNIDLTWRQYTDYISGKKRDVALMDVLKYYHRQYSEPELQKAIYFTHRIKEGLIKQCKNIKTINNAIEFLVSLKNAQKFNMALVTSTSKDLTNLILQKLKIQHVFNFIVTADDVTYSKPNPQGFINALSTFKAKSAYIFEDSLYGLIAANRCRSLYNIQIIGVYRHNKKTLCENLADYCIEQYPKLFTL